MIPDRWMVLLGLFLDGFNYHQPSVLDVTLVCCLERPSWSSFAIFDVSMSSRGFPRHTSTHEYSTLCTHTCKNRYNFCCDCPCTDAMLALWPHHGNLSDNESVMN